MKTLALTVALILLAGQVSGQRSTELTLQHTFGETPDLRLLIAGTTPLSYRLAVVGSPRSRNADGEPVAPPRLTVDAQSVSAGAVSLAGLFAELRTPLADGAGTRHWERTPDLRADTGTEPVSRTGAVVRLPIGVSAAGWRERDRLVAAVAVGAGTRSGGALAIATSVPLEAQTEADGWSAYDGPHERGFVAAGSAVLGGSAAALSAAGAISVPQWSAPGFWMRVGARVAAPHWLDLRFYAAGASPEYTTLTLTRDGGLRLAASAAASAGPVTIRAASRWDAVWHQNRMQTAGIWWDRTGLSAAFRARVIDRRPVRLNGEIDGHLSIAPADGAVSREGRLSWAVSARLADGLFELAVRQSFEITDRTRTGERLRIAIAPGSFVLSPRAQIDASVRVSMETEHEPFTLTPKVVFSGSYRLTGSE